MRHCDFTLTLALNPVRSTEGNFGIKIVFLVLVKSHYFFRGRREATSTSLAVLGVKNDRHLPSPKRKGDSHIGILDVMKHYFIFTVAKLIYNKQESDLVTQRAPKMSDLHSQLPWS